MPVPWFEWSERVIERHVSHSIIVTIRPNQDVTPGVVIHILSKPKGFMFP